jgi:hypothetical protein
VGRNGAGKSNFLDALGFVADALRVPLARALSSRLMAGDRWRRGIGDPAHFTIEVEMDLGGGRHGVYRLELSCDRSRGNLIGIVGERLSVDGGGENTYFSIKDGELTGSSMGQAPPVLPGRLYLPLVAGIPSFSGAYETLTAMYFYSPDLGSMRALQEPGIVEPLRGDGANLSGVLARIAAERPGTMERMKGYLSSIVPEVTDVRRVSLGPVETLEFEQTFPGASGPRTFYAASMSDGTLRVLGILVAVAQLADGTNPVRLVGVEEPETALHPAASAALMDALKEAAVTRQVIVTTQSPDLLDQIDPATDRLLAVEMRDGETVIGPIDRASRDAIREKLFSPGELLRMDQLQADWVDLQRQRQVNPSAPAGGRG